MKHKKKVSAGAKAHQQRPERRKTPVFPTNIEYIQLFDRCEINKQALAETDRIIDTKITANRGRYEQASIIANGGTMLTGIYERPAFGGGIFDIQSPSFSNVDSGLSGAITGKYQMPSLLRDVPSLTSGAMSALDIGGLGNVVKDVSGAALDLLSVNPEPAISPVVKYANSDSPFSLATGLSNNFHDIKNSLNPFSVGIFNQRDFMSRFNTGQRIPWYFIAVIHHMEGGSNFKTHLGNGDPLTGYTVQIPAGRPHVGHGPPFTWEESAADILHYKSLDVVRPWNLGNVLVCLEKYNGGGYAVRHMASPYLWSGSNNYVKGKFISDKVFSADAVSKQLGAAVILKRMEDRGMIYIPRN